MNQSTNIDLIPKLATVENIYFSQYDVGRTVIINLVENATDYEIPTGATVKIQATKPSGLGFSVDCTFSGNAVTVVSTAEMTDEPGQFPCELKITNGATILGTANFTFSVERSPHPDGTTDGTAESVVSEITVALQNALADIQEKGDEVIESIPSDYTELSGEVADLNSNIDEISDAITKNLSPIASMTATGGGNINASCGSVGHVEAGNQYTLSLTNETTKTSNLSIRIIADGTTTQTTIGNKTLVVGERTVYTFVATLTGNVVLNTALGSEYASTVVFTDIQLEVGGVPTWYAKQGELTAIDKVVRNQMESVTETLKDTAFESCVFSVAHQGGNIFGYPQNTIPNFIACAKANWKYVELDVQWTSDNVPVISHDDSRTVYGTSTSVSIANTSYADLQNMQFFADATIKIPSFYDAIDICKLYGLTPFVELKTNATTAQITIIINYLKRKKLFANAFITSFQTGTLITVISIDNNTNTLLNVSSTDSIDDLIASDSRVTTLLNHAGKTTFAFSYTLLAGLADAKAHLAEFSDKGAYVCVYTLDTEALITTYAPMCDYITSNALRVEEVIA